MSRLTQILRGKKVKPLTEMEAAVKYAIENAGSGGGSTGGVLVVNAVYDETTEIYTLDKTWKEINNADFAVLVDVDPESGNKQLWVVDYIYHDTEEGAYWTWWGDHDDPWMFHTNSEDGYPTDADLGGTT